jgi:hypothetical protein
MKEGMIRSMYRTQDGRIHTDLEDVTMSIGEWQGLHLGRALHERKMAIHRTNTC